jgi:hypothetical protein
MTVLLLLLILLVLIFKGSSKYLPHTLILFFVIWLLNQLKIISVKLFEALIGAKYLWGGIAVLIGIVLLVILWQKISRYRIDRYIKKGLDKHGENRDV